MSLYISHFHLTSRICLHAIFLRPQDAFYFTLLCINSDLRNFIFLMTCSKICPWSVFVPPCTIHPNKIVNRTKFGPKELILRLTLLFVTHWTPHTIYAMCPNTLSISILTVFHSSPFYGDHFSIWLLEYWTKLEVHFLISLNREVGSMNRNKQDRNGLTRHLWCARVWKCVTVQAIVKWILM